MTTTRQRQRLDRLARAHHGVVTREELQSIGWTDHAIDWAVGTGVLRVLFPGVYRVNGAPDTWRGRAMAAQRRVDRQVRRRLPPDAALVPLVALAERAAAHLHGLPGHARPKPITLITSCRCRSSLVATRTRRSFAAVDLVEVDRIPAVSLAWNMTELAGLLSSRRYDDLVSGLFASDRLRPGQLLGAAHRAQGVPGQGQAIAAARRVEHTYRSNTEHVLFDAFLAVGLPPPDVNRVVATTSGLAPECDYVWEDEKVEVELDGPHHLLPSQRERDRRRDRALRQDGWSVHRFPVEEVDEDPEDVARRVATVLQERRRTSTPDS